MRASIAVLALLLAACNQQAISELSRCQRELGAADSTLASAQAAQATAEKRAAALEEELKQARTELAAARSGAGTAAAAPEAAVAGRVEGAPGTVKIGLSLPTQREERWVKDKLTMLAEARKRGVELLVQVSENDPQRQKEQCEKLIAQGIKVLILAPSDAARAAQIVDMATRAGVQVISYDRLVTGSPHGYYYLSFDNVRVGELQGEYLARTAPRGAYVLLAGSPTDHNATLFRQGAMRRLQPLIDRGEVRVVLESAVDGWDPAVARKLCADALERSGGRVDAVLAPNDGTAGGCLEALSARGLAGKVVITGQDAELAAAVRLLKGTQGMTVFKDTRLLGARAIVLAQALATGQRVEEDQLVNNGVRSVPAILLAPYGVTRENLDERLIASGYLNRDAVYSRR